MSRLSEALGAGKFVVTGEIGPPKGIDTKEMEEEIHHLRDRVVAVNVTDLQSSVMRLGALVVSARLQAMGVEPVFQVTCRDRNRLALESDLLSAAWMGIENVLALTGDHVILGDHPTARPVFDLDSVSLLQAMVTLEGGKDLAGNDLQGAPKFFKGAVVPPCAEPLDAHLIKLEKKVRAGAQFIQTQAVYEPERFARFMEKVAHLGVPVLVGIVLLKSAAMAKFMNKNVAGVFVPDAIIDEIAKVGKDDRRKKSAEIAGRLVAQMRGMCQGVHLMPLGWCSLVPDVLAAAGL
jgi:5,10-methylenetetrahydrofolate reductase